MPVFLHLGKKFTRSLSSASGFGYLFIYMRYIVWEGCCYCVPVRLNRPPQALLHLPSSPEQAVLQAREEGKRLSAMVLPTLTHHHMFHGMWPRVDASTSTSPSTLLSLFLSLSLFHNDALITVIPGAGGRGGEGSREENAVFRVWETCDESLEDTLLNGESFCRSHLSYKHQDIPSFCHSPLW